MSAAPQVALVDYGAGNLRSVAKALERSGLAVDVTSDPAALRRADGVVLPGVGAFADARASLRGEGARRRGPAPASTRAVPTSGSVSVSSSSSTRATSTA